MNSTVTFDRPVAARLLVRLDNGEEFEPTADDLRKFGYVDPEQTMRRLRAWLSQVHPEVALDSSPLAVFRYVTECALAGDDMPGQDSIDAARALVGAALTMHLVSEHAVGGLVEDPFEMHQHEHDGPGTIRHHDRGDANYDPVKAEAVLSERD